MVSITNLRNLADQLWNLVRWPDKTESLLGDLPALAASFGVSVRVLQKVIGTDAQSLVLRHKFRISQDFHVLLLGRDGHIAASADYLLVPQLLFQVIDLMPMRQEETKITHLKQAPLR